MGLCGLRQYILLLVVEWFLNLASSEDAEAFNWPRLETNVELVSTVTLDFLSFGNFVCAVMS